MLSEKDNKRISKLLSFVLRHQPEAIGLVLDENGWTDTPTLLNKLNEHGYTIDFDTLKYVVDSNAKKRFRFTDSFDKIRANQGHSVDIELDLTALQPPAILYHGTATTTLESIMATGLDKRERQHVHLSADTETAIKVGQRHGKPVVLEVWAGRMYEDGFIFFLSDNGVWLTDHVPARYLACK